MSAKPYIVQQDSPNLVIVPTETYYEPPPKRVKEDSVQNLPTPTKKLENSAFTKKTGAKLNYSGRSINNDVLIDVSKVKKPPASWASNFLQSIGGSSPKFARIYSSAPKLSLSRKENTQLRSEDIILPHTTNNQLNTNTVVIPTIMDKEKSLPKINLNLLTPIKNKQAPQSKPPKVSQTIKPELYTKENSQPHANTKTCQSKSDTTTKTNQAQVRKEPSLPKGYRIPIQSKNKKQVSEPIVDIKPTRPNTLKESDQVNHNTKCQGTGQPKYKKPVTQDMISNRESTVFKRIKDTNNVKINKVETNQDKDSIKSITLINEFHAKKIDELKAKNTTSELRIKKDKPKHNEEINQAKRNKVIARSKSYKENNQLKNDDKDIKQRKNKEINLPRSYRNPCPPEYHKEITSHKSNKESAPPKDIKTISKQNNKKEASYSTKLKTKKYSEISKSSKHKSKHILESESKKHKNHGKLNKQDNLPKTVNESVRPLKPPGSVLSKKENILKLRKSSTEKCNNDKKRYTQNETNKKNIKMSKSNNDERLSKSISPIKSVVTKLNTDHNTDKEKRYHKESDFHSHDNETSGQDFNYNSHKNNSKKYLHRDSDVDLRAKLKRKINKNGHQEDQNLDRGNKKNKFSTIPNGDRFVPDENLIISFDAKDDNEEVTSSLFTEKMVPNKKLARKKSAGGKKCKKIKLEINIVFDHGDTTDEESVKSEEDDTNTEIAENADFSFLDDFNVDEIVKSLNECKDNYKNDNEVQLTVNDAKAKGNQTNDWETNYIKNVPTSQCKALTNGNETKSETAYPNFISSVETKTNEHKEMESQPEVTNTRHHEEIGIEVKDEDGVKNIDKAEHVQYLAVLDDVVVKKEEGISKTIEENPKLHINDNSQDWEGQTAYLALVVANSSSAHIMDQVKTEVDVSRGTDPSQIKNSQDIEVQIASSEVHVDMSTTKNMSQSVIKNTIPMDISRDDIINYHGQDSALNEPTHTKLNNNIEPEKKNIINEDSEVTSKIDNKGDTSTDDKTGVKQTQTSKTSVVEPDVIIILDSDDENETQIKNNQSTKDSYATAGCSMESSIDVESDKVIILDAIATEKSEPILVLDTDHNVGVECNDGDGAKSLLNKIDKKSNTENLRVAENAEKAGIKIDADGTAKHEKTVLEDISTETKIKISAHTKNVYEKLFDNNKSETNNDKHSVSRKTECDNKENGDLSNPDETNEKIVVKTVEELPKSSENSDVAPENSIPKAKPPDAKSQNVNTKKVETQDKVSSANSEKINADDANEKTVMKTLEELPKSPEKIHVAPENSKPKAVPPHAERQNVNTKVVKAQDKKSLANSENINADEANEVTVMKTSKELPKSPEKIQVAPEKSKPKAVPPNAKPQNVNTKEVKTQDKKSLTNSENINADEANEVTVMKTSEELPKLPEKSHVAPEKSIPKAVPSNAKPQNVNTKEVKTQDKVSPANSENINTDEANEQTSAELPKLPEKFHVAAEKSIPKAVPPNAKPQNVNTKEVKTHDKVGPANSENLKANETNKKTVIKTSEELTISPEKFHVAPEKSIPITIPPNAKPQNANTKEIRAHDKDSTSDSGNIDIASKTKNIDAKIKICRQIAFDVFVGKLETKLLSVMGQKYTITKLIRAGKFSKIYACKDAALCDFAVKVFKNESNNSSLQKQNMIVELQNGVPENNLNCVRLVRGFPICPSWCFLMEYYPKNLAEALNQKNKSFHIDEVQNLSRQLVSAVTILRNNNIIHSDIKPSHILINASNTRIKLCGFDQASYFDGRKMFPNTGTANYRAPELILGYPAGYGIDVWSTALVMYEMATNRKLFPGTFNNDILYKQLCTLGSVPLEMLMQSSYRNWHFNGTAFCRILGGTKTVLIHNIIGNDFVNNGLFQTYDQDWAKRKSPAVRLEDKSKLCAFSKLLHSMLAMFPKQRIAIEFVFANPFIYETFDNC